MSSSAEPILPPHADGMRRQFKHVFHGDGVHGGLIELCWTDPRTGALSRAQHFGTHEIEGLIERAVELNRTPGTNCYIGAALRRPETPKDKRGADADFLAASAIWADIDDDVVPAAIAECKARGVAPTLTVVTGRHPHLRAQMWWRLVTPCRGAEILRNLCSNIAQAIGGDPSVVNPGRVLRLGGSVAWPTKEGRVLEKTEVHVAADKDPSRPRQYYLEHLLRAFAPAAGPLATTEPKSVTSEPERNGSQQAVDKIPKPETRPEIAPENIISGGLAIGGMSVEQAFAAVQRGERWHDHVVRLVAHWTSRGWSDAEIMATAEGLTLPNYKPDQTRRELARMIEGARRKWNVPNPVHPIGDDKPAPEINLLDWTADRYAGQARPITWLCQGTIPLGVPMQIAAMGGLGKSYIALDLALHIAAGIVGLEQPRKILGGRIAVEGSAAVITAEDSFDAVHRRLNRIDPTERRLRHSKRLIVLPLPDAGGPRPLIAANGKSLARTPFFDDLKRQLMQLPDLRLVIIDPLQAFVLADVNADPAAAQFLWSAMAELASATGATVLLTHHMRKDGMMRIVDGNDAREAIRGTTALVDGSRLTYALWKLDDEAARPLCASLGIAFARERIVRGAVVKANDEASFDTHTYIREESGLLVQAETEPDAKASAPDFTMAHAREVLKEVDRRFNEGSPFSHAPQAGPRWLGNYLMRQYRMTKRAASELIQDWLNNGIVSIEECNRKTKLMGLKVQKWL
jgi:hypothetical protein